MSTSRLARRTSSRPVTWLKSMTRTLATALLDTLWNVARSQGTVAGRNMAGGRAPYAKPMPLNVTRLAGITTTIIGAVGRWPDADMVGIGRGDSETWRQMRDALVAEDEHEVSRLRLLVGTTHAVGRGGDG